jgi:hypothetical protein
VDAGQRAGELSKQALKIFQQIANDGCSQYLYLFVASSAGTSGVAARFSKLLCEPSREEAKVVDEGQRAGELSKQALKIFQQIASGGRSQYLYLFVASSAVLSRGGSKALEAPVQALGGGDGGGGFRGDVAAGGTGVFGRGGRGAFWIPCRLW